VGVWERLSAAAFMLWIAVLAIALQRESGATLPRSKPSPTYPMIVYSLDRSVQLPLKTVKPGVYLVKSAPRLATVIIFWPATWIS
jgi:hypothetical protein